jgi:hypothetical protein
MNDLYKNLSTQLLPITYICNFLLHLGKIENNVFTKIIVFLIFLKIIFRFESNFYFTSPTRNTTPSFFPKKKLYDLKDNCAHGPTKRRTRAVKGEEKWRGRLRPV